MSKYIQFANGVTVIHKSAISTKRTFQGVNREVITFWFSPEVVDFSTLSTLFKDSTALDSIVFYSDDEVPVPSSELLHFTIPVELSLKTATEQSEEHWELSVAQKSDSEIAQEKLIQDNSDIQLALIELAEIVTGGE